MKKSTAMSLLLLSGLGSWSLLQAQLANLDLTFFLHGDDDHHHYC